MGIIHRLFTANSPSINRRIATLTQRLEAVEDALQLVSKATRTTHQGLQELDGAINKLRGKFYGELGGPKAAAEPATREERRAAALKSVGFVPGKPPPHT
jgi:hypothetical protein